MSFTLATLPLLMSMVLQTEPAPERCYVSLQLEQQQLAAGADRPERIRRWFNLYGRQAIARANNAASSQYFDYGWRPRPGGPSSMEEVYAREQTALNRMSAPSRQAVLEACMAQHDAYEQDSDDSY